MNAMVELREIHDSDRDACARIVYEAFKDPTEQKAFYDTYRGSIKAPLFLIQGPAIANFSK